MRLLLDLGADVNRRDERGFSALMWAAQQGRQESISRLLAAGADPALRDVEGLTAADHAARHGHGDVAKMMKK